MSWNKITWLTDIAAAKNISISTYVFARNATLYFRIPPNKLFVISQASYEANIAGYRWDTDPWVVGWTGVDYYYTFDGPRNGAVTNSADIYQPGGFISKYPNPTNGCGVWLDRAQSYFSKDLPTGHSCMVSEAYIKDVPDCNGNFPLYPDLKNNKNNPPYLFGCGFSTWQGVSKIPKRVSKTALKAVVKTMCSSTTERYTTANFNICKTFYDHYKDSSQLNTTPTDVSDGIAWYKNLPTTKPAWKHADVCKTGDFMAMNDELWCTNLKTQEFNEYLTTAATGTGVLVPPHAMMESWCKEQANATKLPSKEGGSSALLGELKYCNVGLLDLCKKRIYDIAKTKVTGDTTTDIFKEVQKIMDSVAYKEGTSDIKYANICGCYMPPEFYASILEEQKNIFEELNEDPTTQAAQLGKETRTDCFYSDCVNSKIKNRGQSGENCKPVQICVNQVKFDKMEAGNNLIANFELTNNCTQEIIEDDTNVYDNAAADKAAADKAAADKAAADKAADDKVADDKIAADKIAADKIAADKIAADKIAADKIAAEPKTRAPSTSAKGLIILLIMGVFAFIVYIIYKKSKNNGIDGEDGDGDWDGEGDGNWDGGGDGGGEGNWDGEGDGEGDGNWDGGGEGNLGGTDAGNVMIGGGARLRDIWTKYTGSGRTGLIDKLMTLYFRKN
jgi:hypothetical protein